MDPRLPEMKATKTMWTLGQDVRFGLRVLRTNPGFTAVAVFTLALGIAANTTVFSWVDGLLLHPFPGSSGPGRLAVLEMITDAPNGGSQVSYVDARDYGKNLTSISGLALHREDVFSIGDAGAPEPVWGELVSGNYFSVLGIKPVLGRVFTREEEGDKLGAYPVAVISHALWTNRFHADPGLVGRTVRVNRSELTIVGVAPPQFRGTQPGLAFHIWVPVTMGPQLGMAGASMFENRSYRNMYALVRLRPGVAMSQAGAEAASIARNLAVHAPETNRGLGANIVPLWQFKSGAPDLLLGPLRILMAVSTLVLLIVCANVANLLLARSVARYREFGIRVALGARKLRLARQLLIETLLLAALGALAGVPLASWMSDSLQWMVPSVGVSVVTGLELNGRILAFAALSCIVAAVISGAAPALLSSRADVNETLKEGGRAGSPSAHSNRTRSLLVMSEVALAMVAVIAAGLFVRSFHNARLTYPGFDKNNVLLGRFFMSGTGYSPAEVQRFCLMLRERLQSSPGVAGVSYSNFAPLGSTAGPWDDIQVEGYVPAAGEHMTVNRAEIAPGYFKTLRIPQLEGRDFADNDESKRPEVVIVNESFARRYFQGSATIGRKIRCAGTWRTVVGLVRDTRNFNVAETGRPYIYIPLRQRYGRDENLYFFVRTAGDPVQAASLLRREVANLNPAAGGFFAMTFAEWTEVAMLPQKVAASLLGGLGLISLLLAAIGLYSVMSYAVTQRTQEIGVRMALGALPRDVLADVLQRGMLLTGIGLAFGIVIALAVTRLLSSMLVNVDSADPATFAAAAVFLGCVALVANYVPARRATKIDPITALRCE